MKKTLLFAIFMLSTNVFAQNTLTIQELNKQLGKGVNMGNMFEAPSETEWGNPFKDDYFDKIAKLGFNHVRIPIRWDIPSRALQTEPYTINAAFLERIKFVIDKAISNKLYVVINMHHHEELFATPEKAKARFLSQWSQIATYFKNYDQKLVFEVMNEPHDNVTPDVWNVYFKEALQTIRKTNPTRAVLMGTAEYGGLSGVSKLQIPDDKNLILTVHYYNPFNFTHQGAEWIGDDAKNWLGTKWEDLTFERNQVVNEFDFLNTFAKQKNIPVHVGEFGAYSKADLESRVKWTNFLARWFEQQGFSWAYWEFSAGFGIYNPSTDQYVSSLVDALIKNPMPDAKKLSTKEIYKSNFSNGNDGWNLAVQPTASASLSRNNNTLNIDVKTATKDAWFVQLTKTNIALENKKRYLVTCKVFANKTTSVTNYLGKNASPYNSYSGYPSFDLTTNEKTFTYTFIMNDPTDLAARMSFDLGANIANLSISSITIEEVLDNTILANEAYLEKNIIIYPNPTADQIAIDGLNFVGKVQLSDQNGRVIWTKNLQAETSINIDLRNNTAGIYYATIYWGNRSFSKKIIKL